MRDMTDIRTIHPIHIYPTFDAANKAATELDEGDVGDESVIYCPVPRPNGPGFLVLVSVDGDEVGYW